MSIVYRSQKGRRLTSDEVDGNFRFLEDNKQDNLTIDNLPIEDSPNPISSGAVYESLQNIDVSGNNSFRGTFNPSNTTYPYSGGSGTAGAVKAGDTWISSGYGQLGGVSISNGDEIKALIDSPGQTETNWIVVPYKLHPASAYTASFTTILDKETANLNLQFLGDSTTTGTQWPYQLALYISSLYPRWSISIRTWNGSSYPAANYTYTGTAPSPKTLNVWIGAVGGSVVAYYQANTGVITATPDLLILSYGHNNNVIANFEWSYTETIRQIRKKYPQLGNVICIGQNPKAPSAGTYSNGLSNVATIQKMCSNNGYGFVDFMQSFFDYKTGTEYITELLIDDTHPNTLGNTLELNAIKGAFNRKSKASPIGINNSINEFFIPAYQFQPIQGFGSPSLGSWAGAGVGDDINGWLLDPSTIEGISAGLSIPSYWKGFNAYIVWTVNTNPGTGVKNVAWRFHMKSYILDPINDANNTQLGSISNANGGVFNSAAGVQYQPVFSTCVGFNGASFTPSNYAPMQINVLRYASDAGDTLVTDAMFLGVWFKRQ